LLPFSSEYFLHKGAKIKIYLTLMSFVFLHGYTYNVICHTNVRLQIETVGFEVLTAVVIKGFVFSDVKPFSQPTSQGIMPAPSSVLRSKPSKKPA
jgi:hypothetical protein